MELGINMEGGILWKKLMHKSDKREVEGGKKSKESINVEGGFFLWGVECFKICKREFTFIRETRVSQEGEDSSLFRAICMQCLCTPNAFCRFTLP